MNDESFEKSMRKAEMARAQETILDTLNLAKKIAEKHELTKDNPHYRRTKAVCKALEDWRPVDDEWLRGMIRVVGVLFPHPQDYNEMIDGLPNSYSFEEWSGIVERCAEGHDWTAEHAMRDWNRKLDIVRCDLYWLYPGRDPRQVPVVEVWEDPFKRRVSDDDFLHSGFVAHPPF